MATPVPVVSMMYFFVFSPPKTFIIVRPASFALSAKYARGLDDWGFWRLEPSVASTSRTGSRDNKQTGSASRAQRRRGGFLEGMSHRHSRWRPQAGQGTRVMWLVVFIAVLLF